MNLTKDTYEYILNFADDRDIINMLSSNRKFRDDKLFERVMKKRYPIILRFKDENMNWTNFYIQTIFYLSKLKEDFGLPYLPTLDFNPELVYNALSSYKNKAVLKEKIKNIEDTYKEYYNKALHSTVRLIDNKYVVNPNFTKGYPLGYFF